MPNITKGCTGAHNFDAFEQRIMGYLNQPFGFTGQFSCNIHTRCIPVPSINNDRNVDIKNIPIGNFFIPRNTVTNNMIHADAGGMLISAIPNSRRGYAIFCNLLFYEIVNFCCGLSWFNNRNNVIQNFGCNRARFAHSFKI